MSAVMFFARRPSAQVIDRFLRDSRDLPLSYRPTGDVRPEIAGHQVDELTVAVGNGRTDFERARTALASWKQFDIGWVEVFPPQASVSPGTVVAILIRHLGFWSLNGCRVVYEVKDGVGCKYGFAYGTLTNHAESGEELFEVFIDARTQEVIYRIRATSRPQATLAWIGQPVVRLLQARFRTHSAAAMKRAVLRVASA